MPSDAALRRRASLIAAVREAGGIIRSIRLVRLGHSQRTIAEAVAHGDLVRIRRVWVAAPGVDPQRAAAARAGVVLSCVTQARRAGLWLPDDEADTHVGAHPRAGRVAPAAGMRVHRSAPLVPRHPDALEDPIENVLANVCACQPFEAALIVVESALNKRLIDKATFARLPLRSAARTVLDAASPFSDSGLETYVVPRLRWLGVRIVPQAWIAGHRVDFLIGERLVLQIDGGHHVGAQRAGDNRHDAKLRLLGYHVIRVGYLQIMHDWPGVQASIMQAVAQGLHRAA